jgi:hypothetical protein
MLQCLKIVYVPSNPGDKLQTVKLDFKSTSEAQKIRTLTLMYPPLSKSRIYNILHEKFEYSIQIIQRAHTIMESEIKLENQIYEY